MKKIVLAIVSGMWYNKNNKGKERTDMNKFFEAVGYIASVLAAALGIVWLVNKLIDREIDEEIAEECECDCDCDETCECCEEAPATETADAEV